MSCSLSHCFGKAKQKLGVFEINDKIKEALKKGKKNLEIKKRKSKGKSPKKRKSPKRRRRSFGNCKCDCKGCGKRSPSKKLRKRRSRRFGFEVLRNDQIIRLVNDNKVFSNLTCD
jgi:hypothetical protein